MMTTTTPCSLHWFCIFFFRLLLVETCKLLSSFPLITVADIFNGRCTPISGCCWWCCLVLTRASSTSPFAFDLISYECFWPTCWYHIVLPYLEHAIHNYSYWTFAQQQQQQQHRKEEKTHSIYSILVIFHQFRQSILMMWIVFGSTSNGSGLLDRLVSSAVAEGSTCLVHHRMYARE